MANGIPLIFLHAFPLDHRMWDVNLAAFQRHFNVIPLDLPGFGADQTSSETSTMKTMAAHVWRELDRVGVKDKCIFIGLSMGGYALFPVAEQRLEQIRSMVFVSTKATPDTPQARDGRAVNIELVKTKGVSALADKMTPALLGKSTQASKPELLKYVKALIAQQKSEGVCAALRGMAERPDSTNLISNFQFPMFSLWGEEDVIISQDDMKALVQNRPKSDFDTIPATGHLLNLEQPAIFADKISHFLKRRVL